MTHSLKEKIEEKIFYSTQEILDPIPPSESSVLTNQLTKISKAKYSKDEIRSSLRASTLDGVFATLFSSITGGVLISNFLLELKATPLQIGMLASIPMMANLLQPLGAYLADRTTSRRRYNLWIYSISRLLWLPLALAIILYSLHPDHPEPLVFATLSVMLASHILGAIGSASWLSWLATLVPRQLRGRYFGFRNSSFSLTGLVALPLIGVIISCWTGGSIQGFGVMMLAAVVAGLISLGFQSRMVDVNPQANHLEILQPQPQESVLSGSSLTEEIPETHTIASTATRPEGEPHSTLSQPQFLLFLLYFGLWAFGANFSNPFFNVYLLNNLALNLGWVSLYNGLGAGANLLMLLFWGKLADRIGNRSILLLDGVLVALVPLLWLGTGTSSVSIWLWFPLLHLLGGGTGAAIDLCINNLQLAIAPVQQQTKFFATAAAIGGVAGAAGAMAGGWLAQLTEVGGMTGVFAISSVLRLVALLPLVWLQEPQRRPLRETLQRWSTQIKHRFAPSEQDRVPLLEPATPSPVPLSIPIDTYQPNEWQN